MDRKKYRKAITGCFNSAGGILLDPGESSHGSFVGIVSTTQKNFVKELKKIPPGTASNEALCENTFVMAVCIFNKIPLFVSFGIR